MGSKRTSFFNNNGATGTGGDKKGKPAPEAVKMPETEPAGVSPVSSASPSSKRGVVTLVRDWLEREDSSGGGSGDSLTARRERESREERRFFRLTMTIVGGMVLLFLIGFLVTFMASLKGREHTVIPDITGKTLEEGIVELQERGLNVRVVSKYSDAPEDKGRIMDQRPAPGLTVKAGRKVSVVVSKGAIVDKVADYRGKGIDLVTMEIESLFVNYKPLIKVRKPVQYVYSEEPAGTILEQDILPGTPLTSLVEIQFVVSRGPEDLPVEVPNFLGLDYREAVKQLALNNIPFMFRIQEDKVTDTPEVVGQNPSAGDKVMPGTPVTITLSTPKKLEKNVVFGVFAHELPDYESYADISVYRVVGDKDPEPWFFLSHPGGTLSFPYMEKVDTIFILYAFDQEIYRFQVVP